VFWGMQIRTRRKEKAESGRKSGRVPAFLAYGPTGGRFNGLPGLAGAVVIALALVLSVLSPAAAEERRILALGDSLTAGYGLAAEDGFTARLEAALKAAGVAAKVINGGVSGDTSAGGLARVDWLMAEKPDLVIVELGANDALRGLDPVDTRRNLDDVIARIQKAGATVVLAGMKAPPNLGREYTADFDRIFPELAKQHKVALYPFFLDGVAADPALNQADGIHPNAKGVTVIVERMLPTLLHALGEQG
jgi:acyl-CoA thioesterase I